MSTLAKLAKVIFGLEGSQVDLVSTLLQYTASNHRVAIVLSKTACVVSVNVFPPIGVRDGGAGGAVAPPPQFGQFVDMNSGRESILFGQNPIHVRKTRI